MGCFDEEVSCIDISNLKKVDSMFETISDINRGKDIPNLEIPMPHDTAMLGLIWVALRDINKTLTRIAENQEK